jgi:PGF-pre-PGF domain-containing protein
MSLISGTTINVGNWTPSALFNLSGPYSEGLWNISITAVDYAGNSNSTTYVEVRIDKTNPAVSIMINNTVRASGSWINVSGPVNITANITDAASGIIAANFSLVQNGTIVNWTTMSLVSGTIWAGNWTSSAAFNTSAYADGLWNITIQSRDYVNKTNNTQYIQISINNTAPSITSTSGGGTYTNIQTANITVTLNEFAQFCRYATNGSLAYSEMTNNFTNGNSTKSFWTIFTGTYGITYTISIACIDWSNTEARANTSVYFSWTTGPAEIPSGAALPSANEISGIIGSIGAGATGTINIEKFDVQTINIEVINPANNVKITVTKLDAAPASVTVAVTGTVYKYLDIKKENIADANIKKGTINFKVNKAWLSTNNFTADSVKLNRWADNAWNALTTTKTGEETDFYTYSAETPGFSVFAITAKTAEEAAAALCNITCPTGQLLNTTTCTCYTPVTVPTCAADEFLNTTTNTCQKKPTVIAAIPFDYTWIIIAVVIFVIIAVITYLKIQPRYPIMGKRKI